MQVRQCGGNDVYQMFVQSCAVAVPMCTESQKKWIKKEESNPLSSDLVMLSMLRRVHVAYVAHAPC